MGQLTLIQPTLGDQSEKLQNSPKLVLQRCLQKCVPIWWRLIEMAGIPWYIAPLKGCIFHKTLGRKGCWLSVCSSAIHLNWFDSSTKESEFLECMVDLISRQFFICSSKIDHRQNVFLSLILYFPFTFMTKRFFLSPMFFCFFFQKLIFVPVIHVKTLEHVKTSVHITHALVLLDFKVSTVRQVKKLNEQTTNVETKLL